MRAAIVSTYPPRACGIGTFAADVRAGAARGPGHRASRSRRGRQRAVEPAAARSCSRRSRRPFAATTCAPRGCSGGSTSTSSCSSTSTGSSAAATASTCSRSPAASRSRSSSPCTRCSPSRRRIRRTCSRELCGEAELVIVMTETALRLLVASGACPEEKVRVVPHGAPTRLTARAASGPTSAPPAPTPPWATGSCSPPSG